MRTVDPAGFKAMIITIWDYDKLGDDFIGALKLRPGMFFGGIGPGQHDIWLPFGNGIRCDCGYKQGDGEQCNKPFHFCLSISHSGLRVNAYERQR